MRKCPIVDRGAWIPIMTLHLHVLKCPRNAYLNVLEP